MCATCSYQLRQFAIFPPLEGANYSAKTEMRANACDFSYLLGFNNYFMQFVCLFEHKLEAAAAAHQMCPAQYVTVGVCVPRSSLGHGSSLHGKYTTSLPGFENLTMGYNKYLRPYFGGMLASHMGAFKIGL